MDFWHSILSDTAEQTDNGTAQKRAQGTIYFITCEQAGFPIKIGFATDPQKRFAGIQSSLPYKLKVLITAPGTIEQEQEILKICSAFRLRGEWFRRAPELLRLIDHIKDLSAALAAVAPEEVIELPSRPPGMSDQQARRAGLE